jgi:hypothetical protein
MNATEDAILKLLAAHKRIAFLEQMLRNAREKLVLYRQAHSGEYIGGVEFNTLLHSIDAALDYASDTAAEPK